MTAEVSSPTSAGAVVGQGQFEGRAADGLCGGFVGGGVQGGQDTAAGEGQARGSDAAGGGEPPFAAGGSGGVRAELLEVRAS